MKNGVCTSGDMTERDNSFMLKDKFYARKIVLSSTVKEIESFAIPRNTRRVGFERRTGNS